MMILTSTLFKRVTIVGVGLMGGSLGLALRKHNLAKEIIGLSQRQSSLMDAIKCKAIDHGETDFPKALRNADLVVMATPVDSIVKLFPVISPHIRRGCLITDLGSTKLEIIEAAQKKLSFSNFYVGSHPLVGSEKQGVEHARAELFEGATCIMTPLKDSHPSAIRKIEQMWKKIGAHVEMMDPLIHDEMLSYTSHLPHLLAFSLTQAIPSEALKHTPQSLKDVTRIAASSPQMWSDICLSNSRNIVRSMDKFIGELSQIRQAIVDKDNKILLDYFTRAREIRQKLSNNNGA